MNDANSEASNVSSSTSPPALSQSIISSRDRIPMVEVIIWNDNGESHYPGPMKGSQLNYIRSTYGLTHPKDT